MILAAAIKKAVHSFGESAPVKQAGLVRNGRLFWFTEITLLAVDNLTAAGAGFSPVQACALL